MSIPGQLLSLEGMADRVAIQEVIAAYGQLLDAGQWDEFSGLFTEDAEYDISPEVGIIPVPIVGRDAISLAMQGTRGRAVGVLGRQHVSTNVIFHHQDRDRAGTSSFLHVISVPLDGPPELRRTGIYVDEFRKDGERWRFASRRLKLDALSPTVSGSEGS
jgi:hypothetical protein